MNFPVIASFAALGLSLIAPQVIETQARDCVVSGLETRQPISITCGNVVYLWSLIEGEDYVKQELGRIGVAFAIDQIRVLSPNS